MPTDESLFIGRKFLLTTQQLQTNSNLKLYA